MIAVETLKYFDEKVRTWREQDLAKRKLHTTCPGGASIDPAVRRREFLWGQGITVGLLTDREVVDLCRARSVATRWSLTT